MLSQNTQNKTNTEEIVPLEITEVFTTSINDEPKKSKEVFFDKTQSVDESVVVNEIIQNTYIDVSANYIRSQDRPEIEQPPIPDQLFIPAIRLLAPIISADFSSTEIDDETYGQWKAPDNFAVGWHPDSALLGSVGNTVLNGHNNSHGEVFKKLNELEIGDRIYVNSKGERYLFLITNIMILPERDVDIQTKLENSRWLARSNDERLTLVTCWPDNSNSHRLIIVASPIDQAISN